MENALWRSIDIIKLKQKVRHLNDTIKNRNRKFAKNHKYYRFAANGITPDEDTINNFINKWGSFFEYMLAYTVQFSIIAGFTNFENISTDSTVLKAANNKFNVIHKDDAKTLLAYYLGHRVSPKKLKHLRYPAARFRSRGDLSNLKKINILKEILRKFKETGKNTIPINDMEAIHLKDKSGKFLHSYNRPLPFLEYT